MYVLIIIADFIDGLYGYEYASLNLWFVTSLVSLSLLL
jgi:hypothetical protein